MEKSLEVNVTLDDNSNHLITVLIDESQKTTKPYLGGYKNKKDDRVFLNAAIQNGQLGLYKQKPILENPDNYVTTETYICDMRTRSGQTMRTKATQMDKIGILLDHSKDRILKSKKYETSDEYWDKKIKAIRIIQKWTRGGLTRKKVRILKEKKKEEEKKRKEEEDEDDRKKKEYEKKEFERRINPLMKEDFEIVLKELEAWKQREKRMITDNKEELELLYKEIKILQNLDKQKIIANKYHKERNINRMLDKITQPKIFNTRKGNKVMVETPLTTRSQTLKNIFETIKNEEMDIDSRMNILLTLKWTVSEFNTNLTNEIILLINRELDLIERNRNIEGMIGLRKRIEFLFLQFIQDPLYNPEAKILKKHL